MIKPALPLEGYKYLRRDTPPSASLLHRPSASMPSGAVGDVIDWLGRSIAGEHFPIGSTLPMENELGDMVGVSRTVIREAVKIVSSKGVLRTARRYGTVVCPMDDWNLLDAEVIRWFAPSDSATRMIFSELVELLAIVLPQAVSASAGSLAAVPGPVTTLALQTLQDHQSAVADRVRAEYSLWAQILDAPKAAIYAQFRGLVFEMIRLTYAFEDRHPGTDAIFGELMQQVSQRHTQEADLNCRLLLKRSRSLI